MSARLGRPSLGHVGHTAQPDRCTACRLREAREALGLTQPQAADCLAASLRAYKAWERGEARVPPLALREIFRRKMARDYAVSMVLERVAMDPAEKPLTRTARQA